MSKKLEECEKVFFDTGPLIDALRVGSKDERHALTVNLMRYLSEQKTVHGRHRRFFISAISLSEMANLSSQNDAIRKFARVFDVSNLEILAYDRRVAILQNQIFQGLLSRKTQNEFVRSANRSPGNLILAREWISRDMMIIATAALEAVDMVFTSDRKTFLPLALKAGLLCKVIDRKNFEKPSVEGMPKLV